MYAECVECGNETTVAKCRTLYEDVYCEECIDEALWCDLVKDSSYKPTPKFFKMKEEEKLCMGFELEVETDYKGLGAQKFLKFLDRNNLKEMFYIKEDCSVEGFEIVSHPFSLNYLKKRIKIAKMLGWLRYHSFDSYEGGNCGLHIHLSKDYFTQEDMVKLRCFFALNRKNLWDFSRRDDDQYCRQENYDLEEFLNGEHNADDDRYWALNFNTYQPTIEIRIFRGTLDFSRFMSNLEFAKAISIYCNKFLLKDVVQGGNSSRSWSVFLEWLEKQRKYSYLKKVLKEDGVYIKEEAKNDGEKTAVITRVL